MLMILFIKMYLPIIAVAVARACRRFSLCCLLTFSASARPSWSRFFGSGILNVGPGVPAMGVSPPSKRKGVPSMLPQVIRGDASTPEVHDRKSVTLKYEPAVYIFMKIEVLPLINPSSPNSV